MIMQRCTSKSCESSQLTVEKSGTDRASNTGNSSVSLSVALETPFNGVNGTIISGPDPHAFNYKNNQTGIVPVALNITSNSRKAGEDWAWDVPAFSITVLQFNI